MSSETSSGKSLFSLREVRSINRQFRLDALDDWQTTAGLAESFKAVVQQQIGKKDLSLFILVPEAREFREIDREGLASVPEDSLFTGWLSMQKGLLELEEVFRDGLVDDPLLTALFRQSYNSRWIIPVIHRFRLLAFILLPAGEDGSDLKPEEEMFLAEAADRLGINLYAAYVADNRQRSLLALAAFPGSLQKFPSLDELRRNLLDTVRREISFDTGVFYLFEDYRKVLIPADWKGLDEEPETIRADAGLSGHVFQSLKAVSVPNRETHPAFSTITEEPFISHSFIAAPVYTDKRQFGVIILGRHKKRRQNFGSEQRYMLEIISSFIAAELDSRILYDRLENSYFGTITSLTRALEAKDTYTKGHSERVMEYSLGIARELGLKPSSLRTIRYGAILHDIGKIGIKDAIIDKMDKLSEDEYDAIKKHTEIGYEILDSEGVWGEIRKLIRYHHEKMDGSGYYGKKMGDYPWEAMIISLADIFDALTSKRSYRDPLSRSEAVEVIRKLVNVNFDSAIFEAFLAYLSSLEG